MSFPGIFHKKIESKSRRIEHGNFMYYVYLIQCEDGSIYTGITTDLERRFKEHEGKVGGHYTRAHKVEKILYTEKYPTRSEALKREAQIKKLRRKEKLNLERLDFINYKNFMKKQVVVIHGGTTFDSYEKYISYLKNREVNIDKFKVRKDWKDALEKELESDFEVFAPRMPNGTNACYEEWKIWFDRIIPFLANDIILAGHSLGGIFLAKYLSENFLPKKIKALILVATPFDDENSEESLNDFALPASLAKITEQVNKIYIFHSKDDSVVPFEQADKYKNALPNSEVIVFTDRQHFNQEFFPELIELLKIL